MIKHKRGRVISPETVKVLFVSLMVLLGFVSFRGYLQYNEKSTEYTGVKFQASVAAFSLSS